MESFTLPSIKVVHNAIRNYLVNELGINKAFIEDVIERQVRSVVTKWFDAQLVTRGSFVRKFMTDIIGQVAEKHLQRNLHVALSKVETKAEIVIVDHRLADDT